MNKQRANRVSASLLILVFCLSVARGQALAPRDTVPRERARLASEAARRGAALRHEWNLDAAEAAFREAIKLDAANLEAHLGLSRIARARFDYTAALAWLDQAKAAGAGSADWLAEYGTIYL